MLNCHLNCLANSFLKGRSVSLFFLFVWGLGWNNVQGATLIFALKVALNAAVETRVYWRSRLIRSNQQHLGSPSAGDNQLQTGGRLFCCGLPSCVSVPSLFLKFFVSLSTCCFDVFPRWWSLAAWFGVLGCKYFCYFGLNKSTPVQRRSCKVFESCSSFASSAEPFDSLSPHD